MSQEAHERRRNHRTREPERVDASMQPAPSDIARDINREIILKLIRFNQPLARADLSRLSGLRRSTVSSIVEQLIQENWIREGAVIKAPRGRPSTMLSVNSALVTFALDIRPDRAILAVVDLSGRFLSRETIPLASNLRRTVSQIAKRIHALRTEHSSMSFEGIGISIPGRVHPVTHSVLLAPNLRWHSFDIKAALERETNLQVELDNDANVCLLSELWYGRLQGIHDVALIAVGEGIGTAILAGGVMQSGHNGLAGEFGHVSVDPAGPLCQCGQNGCWEMVASSRAAVRILNSAGRRKVEEIHELIRLCHDGDPAAAHALTEQARALGRGLRMITAALSPERILLVGDITACWDRFGPVVASELAACMLAGDPPRLHAAGDAELARLLGSAAMLMQRHAGYRHSPHA